MNEVEIDCFNCDGSGWTITYQWSGYPEQERCETCGGNKKIIVDAVAAKILRGELL